MIYPLLLKEARLQAPFLALVLAFVVIDWVDILVERSPELYGADSLMNVVVDDDEASAIALFLLAFSFSTGLLTREIDERTQEFVDALPVSRSRIFAAKVCFSLAILGLLVLSDALIGVWTFRLSASSLRPGIPWPWILDGAVFGAAQLLTYFSVGLLLSFARPYSWICFGLLFWVLKLATAFEPRAQLVNPFTLASGYLRTTPATWPVEHLAALLVVSASALALAYLAYVRAESSGPAGAGESRALPQRPWRRNLLGSATGAIVVATFVFLVVRDKEPAAGTLSRPRRATANAKTEHYVVTYPATLAERARVLLEGADAIHDEVADALGVVETAIIAVDATGSQPGTAGTASWTKIRLNLRGRNDPAELAGVLGHETVHVYVSLLSKQAVDEDPSSAFFHEGVATMLEYDLFRSDQERSRLRIHAAAIDERFEIPFHTLLDEGVVKDRYAREVLYPLGERFFSSISERHGPDAVGKLLSVMGDEAFPGKTVGFERWRIAFQQAGFDLETEISAWKAALGLDRKAFSEQIAALPRLIPEIAVSDGAIHFALPQAAPAGHALVCRFRPDATAAEVSWIEKSIPTGTECSIDEEALARPFQYQLGLREMGTERVLWEAWETLAR